MLINPGRLKLPYLQLGQGHFFVVSQAPFANRLLAHPLGRQGLVLPQWGSQQNELPFQSIFGTGG
jgi:hypothetical protein